MAQHKIVKDGETRKTLSRSDLRDATIRGYTRMKSDPRSVKLTPGQRQFITKRKVG